MPCPAAPRLLMSASGRLVSWLIQLVGGNLQARKEQAIKAGYVYQRQIRASNGRRPNPPARDAIIGIAGWVGSGRVSAAFLACLVGRCPPLPGQWLA
ncbi:hypothetical protein Bpro_4679 [Polaromonas sp. JS666]|nr:hypothetical protein Bpro_4679 [Polaromonas sp. JS666]